MATQAEIDEKARIKEIRMPAIREAQDKLKNLLESDDQDPSDMTPDRKWDMILDLTREEYRTTEDGWFVPTFYGQRLQTMALLLSDEAFEKLMGMATGMQIMMIQDMVKKGIIF